MYINLNRIRTRTTLGLVNLADEYLAPKFLFHLFMKDVTPARGGEDTWCTQDQLCLETQCKLEGLKMMARWLLGLKSDEVAAQKTYRMLNAIIENNGDLLEEGKPNPAEKSWLRLSAGCAMLKISEQKGVGDQFTTGRVGNGYFWNGSG